MEPIILRPGAGDAYCPSEWSVEPGGNGPGPHHHDANEEVFLPGGFEAPLREWFESRR
jgi:hypothetical protein